MYLYIGTTQDNIIKVGISSRNIRYREKEIQKYYKYDTFKMVNCIGINAEDNIVKQIEFMVRGSMMGLTKGLTLIGDDFILCEEAEQKQILIDMFEIIVFNILQDYINVELINDITIMPMELIPYTNMFDKAQSLIERGN